MDKNLNRLKVVLAEKKRPIVGWQSSWARPSIPFLGGVTTSPSLRWHS